MSYLSGFDCSIWRDRVARQNASIFMLQEITVKRYSRTEEERVSERWSVHTSPSYQARFLPIDRNETGALPLHILSKEFLNLSL